MKKHYLRDELYQLIKDDENIFDFIQEASLDGLWYWDLEQPENEWMNPKFWTTLGYNPDEMPHKVTSWQHIIDEKDLKIALKEVKKHLENPDYLYEQIIKYTHKNGFPVWIRCKGIAIRDKDGKPIRMLGAHTDITAQIQTNISLQETNERLTSILTHISDFSLVINADYQVLAYYKAKIDNQIDFVGKKIHEIKSLENIFYYIKTAVSSAIITKEKINIEYNIEKGHETKYFCLTTSVLNWEGRKPREIICFFQDITERKETEIALKRSEERFRLAIQATKDGLWEWDIETGKEFFSPRWCEIVGYEDNDPEMSNNFDFWVSKIHPDDYSYVMQNIENHLEKGTPYNIEYRFLHKSGKYIWQSSRGQSVWDSTGKAKKMVGFVSDISYRKDAEYQLKQVSQLYQTLLDNVPGYVVCRNEKGEFLFVNKEFAALFNKKPEEVVGLTDAFYGATEEEIASYLAADKQVLTSGKPLLIDDVKVLRKDGTRGLFQVTKVPLNISEHEGKSVLVVATDITERKAVEKRLLESEQKLLQKSKILSAIAKTTEKLLVNENINEVLSQSFHLIGEATQVDRVCYFEYDRQTSLRHYRIEWTVESAVKQFDNPKLNNTTFEDLEEYMPYLLENKPYQNLVRKVKNPQIRQRLQEQDILSILLLPIFVKGQFYGFIGFDDCKQERHWSEDDLNVFQSLVTNIANSIEKIDNELLIKESESNFRQINETIEDVFWLYDLVNRKYIYMSPSCEKVLEIEQAAFYENRYKAHTHIFEDDKNKFAEAEDTLKTTDSYDIEYRMIMADGRIKWINEKSFAIRNDKGELIRNSGICTDITEKKQTQAELKQLSLVAEKSTNGIVISDKEGRVLWANQGFLDMFEVPLEVLLHQRPRDIFNPHSKELLDEIAEVNGTNFTKSFSVTTYKNNKKWIELNNTVVLDENGEILQQLEILTDITERKQVEAKLAEERHLLREIIDNVPINIYVKDLSGRKVLANKSEYEFVGAKSEAEVLGKDDFDLYDREVADRTLAEDLRVMQEKQALLAYESVCYKKNGQKNWILASKIPLKNKDGKVVGLVGISLDITERKKIEAVRQMDLEIERIVNTFSQSIFQQNNIEDLLWEVIRNSVASLALDDIVIYLTDDSGKNLVQKAAYGDKNPIGNEILNPLTIPFGQGIVGNVAQTGIAEIIADTSLDERYLLDNKNRLSEIAVPIMLNGKVIGVINSEHQEKDFYNEKHLRILTTIANLIANRIDRILVEEKIKESEARFRFIAENTSDGIFVTEDRIVTYTSPSCEKILGYTFEQFREQSKHDLLEYIHPDDVEGFRKEMNWVISEQKNAFNYEYRTKNSTGKYIWREDNINIVYNELGKPVKFVIVIRDSTEKVEKKQQLQHLLDVTSKQNERLMNFAQIVSHNIRSHSSNLSMIVGFVEEMYPDLMANTGINYLQMLKQSTEKLAETIENLNEIITIQNNLNTPKTDLYIKTEIDKTLNVLNTIMLVNEAVIINEVPLDCKIKGITSYIESIFLNLLTNALKYRSKDRKPVIHISAKRENNYWIISVKDNGLGIDMKRHGHKIFGMYKTFHKNADARGIGLFITKNQVEAMGGKIEVTSEVEVGTTFHVHLYEES